MTADPFISVCQMKTEVPGTKAVAAMRRATLYVDAHESGNAVNKVRRYGGGSDRCAPGSAATSEPAAQNISEWLP
jgi:hypothetical protein